MFKIGGYITTIKANKYNSFWVKLRDKYVGQKTWLVVANGPSLCSDDLKSLSDIPSIASNKITLMFSGSKWRPTLYTVADPLLLFKLDIHHYSQVPYTLTSTNGFYMVKSSNKAPWKMLTYKSGLKLYDESNELPEPLKRGFFGSKTITISNIQIAMWLGAKTIYLIGCDHDYDEKPLENVNKISHGDKSNHFHSDYRKEGEIVNNAPIQLMNDGFEFVNKIAQYHGVRIINISRKTKLKCFETSTVEEALNQLDIK